MALNQPSNNKKVAASINTEKAAMSNNTEQSGMSSWDRAAESEQQEASSYENFFFLAFLLDRLRCL